MWEPIFLHTGAFSFTHRELEEQITCAYKDISVLSDLDWLVEGASNLFNVMSTNLSASSGAVHHSPLCQPSVAYEGFSPLKTSHGDSKIDPGRFETVSPQ